MTKPSSWGGRFAALLLLPVGLLPLLFAAQRPIPHVPAHRFQDWSTRHTIYSQTGTSAAIEAARSDPRAIFRWREVEQREFQQRQLRSFALFGRRPPRRFPTRASAIMQSDWSISLGTAGTAATMYPAKYTFDVTAIPSCSADFVVFPVNAVGSATQANLVAFNNLYSGTAGGTGICNRTVTTNDTGVAATVLWSYNVESTINGGVPTSPALSVDGTKVAFVESAAGQAHFHVLAWKSGDGQVANLQSTRSPVTLSTFSATAPAAGSGEATDLLLATVTATGSDTLSSPYIDYINDLAYIGNDKGSVFRLKNVFCTTAACGTAAPTIDTSWGVQGAVTIGGTCTGALTAPVLDFNNLTVYVGCADGKLYSISPTFVVKSLAVGDGTAAKIYGGIVDPPLVDVVNNYVYAVSGSAGNGANAVLVQAKVDFSSSVAVPIGLGNQCNLHSPTPNNAYFTSITSTGVLMYIGGLGTTGTVPQPCTGGSNGSANVFLYGVTFGATGKMTAGAPAKSLNLGGGPGYEFAPMTEFFNSTTATDWLFYSAIQSAQTNLASSNVTAGFPTAFTAVTEGVGTSGMIVDNNASTATYPQAASVYFNALQQNAACNNNANGGGTLGCAVKLTQAALQ